jgi:hypothetical protein
MKGVKCVKETETLKLVNYKKGPSLLGSQVEEGHIDKGHCICLMLSSAYHLGKHSADVIKHSANIR